MSMSGMDGMSGTGMSGGQQGSMTSYLHFSPLTDTLWFQYWVPSSPGSLFGACLGLFLLAIFERWLAAGRAIAERSWGRSAQLAMMDRFNKPMRDLDLPASSSDSKAPVKAQDTSQAGNNGRNVFLKAALRGIYMPPFIPSHDIPRGIIHIVQTFIGFLFMLAVMTFQASFIISISIGAGVGEMLFGRYISGAYHH